MMWTRIVLIGTLLALAASGCGPPPQGAAPEGRHVTFHPFSDTLIGFDDAPEGTVIDSQYQSRGITLRMVQGSESVTADPKAASPPNVLALYGSGEIAYPILVGTFTSPRSHVQVSVGDRGPGTETAAVTLSAADLAGNPIASVPAAKASVQGDAGYQTVLRLVANAPLIYQIVIQAPVHTNVAIDDLSFEAEAGEVPADFALSATLAPLVLGHGTSITTPIVVHRTSTSTGPIQLAVSGLPPGVTAQIDPQAITGPDGATATLKLSAAADAPSANATLTVTGTPSPTAGSAAHAIQLPLEVLSSYDAQIWGVEVTQGVQSFDLPQRGATIDAPVDYSGAELAQGGKTIVRVFANLAVPPQGGSLPHVQARLYGTSGGAPLPGSPLSAEQPSLVLQSPRGIDAERADPSAPFTFTLPHAWTTVNTLDLKAEIVPPDPRFFNAAECADPSCAADNTFTLRGIPFYPTRSFHVFPVELMVNYQHLTVTPEQAFADALNLVPVGEGQFPLPSQYWGEIDITDIAGSNKSAGDKADDAADRLDDAAEDWNFEDQYAQGYLTLGVVEKSNCNAATVVGGVTTDEGPIYDADAIKVAVVEAPCRPLTSLGHELFHILGRHHASNANGGGNNGMAYDDWPPDQMGYLQSIGIDRRGLKAGGLQVPGYYPVFAPGRNGTPPLFYDFMSYAASVYDVESRLMPAGWTQNDWISLRGWNLTMDKIRSDGAWPDRVGTEGGGSGPPRGLAPVETPLLVRAIATVSGTRLTRVAPWPGALHPAPGPAPYHLVARDAMGNVLSDTPMHGGEPVDVMPMEGSGSAFLFATAPASAASVEISRDGVVLAQRPRSSHAPAVEIVAPASGATVGRGDTTLVQWKSADADGDRLMARVDYSIDRGMSWRPLFVGPDMGQATLRSTLFPQGDCGMVRVRINDGFNETAAVSPCFQALGRPPAVRITSPQDGTVIASAASLYLGGQAFDDQGRPIPDQQVRWMDGDQVLGNGPLRSVSGLKPGKHVLALSAQDALGRMGGASVTVEVLCGDDPACKTAPGCGSCAAQGRAGDGGAPLGLLGGVLLLGLGFRGRRSWRGVWRPGAVCATPFAPCPSRSVKPVN